MANEFKVRKGLVVNGSGSVLLDIQGSQGQLFSVTDQLSGSLFSISDISGIPVMEAFSDNTVKIGRYGFEAIKVSGSVASVTGSFSGSFSGSFFGASTSASFASTSSFANSFNVAGNLTASNALLSGTLTAQTLVVQTITSSIDFVTGSTRFGSLLTNTHTFTGSVFITGSLTVNTTGTEFQVNNNGVVMGNVLTDNHSVTGSLRVTGSQYIFGNVGIGSTTIYNGGGFSRVLSLYDPSTVALSLVTSAKQFQVGISGTDNDYRIYDFTNTTYRFAINGSTGNVGIGTTAPTGAFEVSTASAGVTVGDFVVDTTNKYVYVGRQSSTSGDNTTFVVRDRTGTARATIPGGGSLDTVFSVNNSNFNFTNYGGGSLFFVSGSGNVGIGTTSPTAKLDVNGEIRMTGSTLFRGMSSNTLQLCGGTSSSNVKIDGSTEIITMDTNGGERLRITANGYTKMSNTGTYAEVGGLYHEFYGGAANGYTLIVMSPVATPLSQYIFDIRFSVATPNNTSARFLHCSDATATRAIIRSNGGLANYQSNNADLSDIRTKKDIISLESYWNKFKALEIVKYKYKDQTHEDYNIGVIAQQVEVVAPEFVDVDGWSKNDIESESPLKSIYTKDLYHATIKVLQEAMEKIETLEAKVIALENK